MAGLLTLELVGCQLNDNLVAGEGGAGGSGGHAEKGGFPGAGGSLAVGGSTTTGGSSGGGAAAVGGTGGLGGSLAEFCTGAPKVELNGKGWPTFATSFEPLTPFDCCWLYALRLHTSESIGVDLEVIAKVGVNPEPGEYFVSSSMGSWPVAAGLRTAADTAILGQLAEGSVRFARDSAGAGPWQMGVCLEVTEPSVPLGGTRVYVPGVAMNWAEASPHFAVRLLADSSLTVRDVTDLPLDSLALASRSLLADSNLSYVERATSFIGFDTSKVDGESIRSSIGDVPVYGKPFVVEAGGARIYLGAFMTMVSSVAYALPTVMVEGIAPDGFAVDIAPSAPDPRDDPRIVQELSEIGKYVP